MWQERRDLNPVHRRGREVDRHGPAIGIAEVNPGKTSLPTRANHPTCFVMNNSKNGWSWDFNSIPSVCESCPTCINGYRQPRRSPGMVGG